MVESVPVQYHISISIFKFESQGQAQISETGSIPDIAYTSTPECPVKLIQSESTGFKVLPSIHKFFNIPIGRHVKIQRFR